jgi:hypothetical protein
MRAAAMSSFEGEPDRGQRGVGTARMRKLLTAAPRAFSISDLPKVGNKGSDAVGRQTVPCWRRVIAG